MWRGVRWYLVGLGGLGLLGVLAGCSGGSFFSQPRAPWRHDAEVQCLNSGAIHEGVGKVRIKQIDGPGMCGADFPLKVSLLGEESPLGYSDELRPPASIPSAKHAMPRWPISQARPSPAPPYSPVETHALPAPPYENAPGYEPAPLPLDPPSNVASTDRPYDFRKPYGGPEPAATARRTGSSTYDLSPVRLEDRHVFGRDSNARYDPAAATRRALDRASERAQPVVPLGPSRGPQVASIGRVSVHPSATLACPLASALDHWISEAVQPAAMRWFGQPVVEIRQISAYSCRGMNGNPNAHISEHAFGNALDVAAFTLADGRKITVQHGWHGAPEEQGFLRDVQGAACDRFTTVLAPGYNRFHYNHIHVDLMRRRGGRRACQPHAVSGAEVAARARAAYAAKHDGYTSAIGRKASRARSFAPIAYSDDRSDRGLPLAQPGADGED